MPGIVDDVAYDAHVDPGYVAAVATAPAPEVRELELMLMSPRELLKHAAVLPVEDRYGVLTRLDPAELDEWETEELARLLATVLSSVSAFQVRTRAAVGVRCRSAKVSYAATSLMHAEHVSKTAAAGRLAFATAVLVRLPNLLAALADGRIGPDHLRLAHTATRTLTEAQCHAVEAQLLGELDRTPGELERIALKLAAAIDPPDLDERHKLSRAQRCAYVKPLPDGMAFLGVAAPAEQIAASWLEIDRRGRALRAAGDPRTLAQLCCDLFLGAPFALPADLASQSHNHHGRPVRMVVHLDLATLLRANNTPGYIDGLGPVPAEIARRLAGQAAEWFRMVIDPTSGVCRDYGRLKKPGQDLTDLIIGSYPTCACGCGRPVALTKVDLDHIKERQRGGLTTEDNLEPLTEHCHTERTEGGWQPARQPDGSIVWTSPSGHTALVRPADHRLGPVDPIDPFRPESDPDPPPF